MPTTAHPSVLTLPDSAAMPRRRWTREDCRRLLSLGFLPEGGWELIAGEIIEKMGQGRRHIFVCSRLFAALGRIFGYERIQSQAPIPLDDRNDPEPDAAVLRAPLSDYLETEPTPSDVELVVEVSDTTLSTDQTVKALLYARAGIPEYWIVNLPERVVEVYRQPTLEGYAEKTVIGEGELLHPLAAPASAISVADLLP